MITISFTMRRRKVFPHIYKIRCRKVQAFCHVGFLSQA